MCLYRFEEHDVFLPMIVLEELDSNKKGMTEVARNARQTSRSLDALVAHHQEADITTGIQLSGTGHREVGGRLFFQTQPLNFTLPPSLPQGKADNQILGVVEALRVQYAPRPVVLVSKDINMRVKARALGLLAEDYQNDKTLEDGDLLYSGALALPHDFWIKHAKSVESWQSGSQTFYRLSGPIVPELHINQFVYFESPGEPSLYARVTEIRGKTVVLKTLKDFTHLKNAVWGVTTRNREQNFAMNLLTDPEIDFVTLTGTAGTGKTLMALAAGFTDWIGLHAVFGAFVMGIAMPRGLVAKALIGRIQPLTVALLLPLFFTYSGLNTQIGLLDSAYLWGMTGLILVAAIGGKGVACWLAARATGLSNREALGIGTLMNARGLMELIIINIGLQRGIITPALFATLVIMAVVTTLMASPLFELLVGRHRPATEP